MMPPMYIGAIICSARILIVKLLPLTQVVDDSTIKDTCTNTFEAGGWRLLAPFDAL